MPVTKIIAIDMENRYLINNGGELFVTVLIFENEP